MLPCGTSRPARDSGGVEAPTTMRYMPDGPGLDGTPHLRLGVAPPARPAPALQLGVEPGVPVLPGCEADTATALVLNLLRSPAGRARIERIDAVTAATFSGDHLFAMWALAEPDAALARAEALDDAARAVEYGVCRSDEATQIACFCRAYPEETGVQEPALLYSALLPQVQALLDRPKDFDLYWIGEYSDVLRANHMLHSGAVVVDDHPELDLTVIHTPLRLHDFTRLTVASQFRLLTVRSENTYMLEYRRESWTQFRSRRPQPRIDLRPLATRLNMFELAQGTWRAGALDEPVPRLIFDDGRGVASPSKIDADTVIAEVLDHLREGARRPELWWRPPPAAAPSAPEKP